MKNIYLTFIILFIGNVILAQVPGYYNGTENKSGDELKNAINAIISGHVDFSYSDSKAILNYADEDPSNTANLIQFYTNRSVDKSTTWGTGNDQTNREHVWAKSHGNFVDIRPMDGDAHNLHPADASVNIARSNRDFDDVTGGTYIEEADAYYLGEAFEPADRDKGVVARTLFYMAVRYEGANGELDLEMVDRINTASETVAEHGKLSTLLQWNRDFPPTDFERRRNERVCQSQLNRNPFVDHPEYADLIWGEATPAALSLSSVAMSPTNPTASENVTISAILSGVDPLPSATLYWGKTFNSETYSIAFTVAPNISATMALNDFTGNELVYLKVVASTGEVWHHSFYVAPNETLTAINAVQGTGTASPLVNQIVSVAGIVTANFDNSFYMQTSSGSIQSGICVFNQWRGKIGDSVVVKGKVVEYQNLTELSEVTMVYTYGNSVIAEPTELSIANLNENYEGMVVKLNGVSFSNAGELITPAGGTYTLSDGTHTIPVYARYNSRLTGYYIPNGTVNVTAILSQYQNNYQLLIDNMSWIDQGSDITAPTIINAKATDASYIEVSFSEKIKESTITADAFSIEGLTIIGAYYYPSTQVYLLVSGMQKQDYTLVVNGVEDLFGNVATDASFTFTSPFGTGINQNENASISVIPNPSQGDFKVAFNAPTTDQTLLQVIDLTGRQVYSELIAAGTISHQLNFDGNLKKGCYVLTIQGTKETTIRKIIIE